MRCMFVLAQLLALAAVLQSVQADEPTITSSDTMMEFKIGGAKLTIEASPGCTSSVPAPPLATVAALNTDATQLQTSLSSAIATGATATTTAAGTAGAATTAAAQTLIGALSAAHAYVSSLRSVAGASLDNLATTAQVNATSSQLSARILTTAQAQTATASRLEAAVTSHNAVLMAGVTATASAATAYVAGLKTATGATFGTLVTQATIDTAVSSIRSAAYTNVGTQSSSAVSAATAAVATQGSTVAATAVQAGQIVALASTIRAKAGALMENLPATTYAQGTMNTTQTTVSTSIQAQSNVSVSLTQSLTSLASSATVNVTATIASGLTYIGTYRATAGASLQNLATTTILTGQISQLTADISNTASTQQAATATAAPIAISAAITSLNPLVTGQNARVALGEARTSNLTAITTANSNSVRLNTADISTALTSVDAFSAQLATLASTRTTTSVNSSSLLTGVTQQLTNEIQRALTAESNIQVAESTLISAAAATPVALITNCQNQGLVLGSLTTHACRDAAINNCNANTITRARMNGFVMEYCDGTSWVPIINLIGQTLPLFSTSCQAIYTSQGVDARSGVYFIGTSALDAAPAYCQMRPDGGWMMIAMMADTDDETWQFISTYWTDTQLINPTVVDPMSDVHMKNNFFVTRSFTKIRFYLSSIDTFPLTITTTQTSAQQMFLLGSNIVGTGTALTRGYFQNTCNNPRLLETQAYCNQWGINSYTSTGAARFGMQFNEQNDCSSCDSAIGLGIYLNSQSAPASGYGRIGSGFITFSPNTRYTRRGWIFIQ